MVLSHGRNWMCTSAGSVTTMWSSSVLHSANVWPVHDLIVSCFRGPVMPTRLFRSVSFQFDGFISSSKECLTAKARASESFMSYNWESSNAKRKWLLR
uniref:Uncharacterized protein n=1 Tax=Setaria viridis TaxID=4556 RepID=A0A4U6VYY0_SETVI|nr:hypothetical protein SEVIR_2G299850v2 [Setaria viridis]